MKFLTMANKDLNKKVQRAYAKLKHALYYERLDIISRDAISNFENDHNHDLDELDSKLANIADWLKETRVREIPQKIQKEIDKIGLSLYVKKLKAEPKGASNFISDEVELNGYSLEKENAFIRASIPLQILGIMWIEEIGYKLDKELSKDVYGNRLLKPDPELPEFKGGLFKLYHHQYAKWWQKGLKKAKTILREDEQDVVMINMDIKGFYHNIRLDLASLREAVNYKDLKPYAKLLHRTIEQVLIKYNTLKWMGQSKAEADKYSLPIMFFPSNVLANWYLRDFDEAIRDLRPAYYGRYVDDLFLVFKSVVPKSAESRENDKDTLIDQEVLPDEKLKETLGEAEYRFIKYLKGSIIVRLKTKPTDVEFDLPLADNLSVQRDKLFVYELSVNSPANIIENFIREQREKSSEFRFEAEDSDQISSDFGDILFEQSFEKDDASKAKIKNLSEDKFTLSVFLSRLLKRSSQSPKKKQVKQLKKIVSYYRGANCIGSWWIWEKIILALVINDQYELFQKFVRAANESIENLKASSKLKSRRIIFRVRSNMKTVLGIAIKNGLAGKPEFADDQIQKFLEKDGLFQDPAPVRKSSFVRNEYVSFPLFGLLNSNLINKTSFFSSESIQESLDSCKFEISSISKKYPPLSVKYWQVAYIEWCRRLYDLDTRSGSSLRRTFIGSDLSSRDILLTAFDEYFNINYFNNGIDQEEFRKKWFFKVSAEYKPTPFNQDDQVEPNKYGLQKVEFRMAAESKDSLRFGLVNEFVNKKNYYNSAKGEPVDFKRLETCKRILDDAQLKKCDIVIQPELAVPHAFIPEYCQYADRHQMGIVAGIEHLRAKDVVFNFILSVIPIQVEGVYKDAIPVLRLKNHYAPKEEEMVQKIRATVPKPIDYEYHLFSWRGLYFTNYYCYELADIKHRAIFQGEIDVLIAPVWNADTNYYNGIVETGAREIHCIFSQVNTSNYGDTRWTLPAKTEKKNPLIMKGGTVKQHPFTMALCDYKPKALREFQNLDFSGQKEREDFKPTPPDYPKEKAVKRVKYETFYIKE